MPIPFVASTIANGLPFGLTYWGIFKVSSIILVLVAVKWFCNGATNSSERQMHSKVIMITGGTTGIGAQVALNLATRGAQLVLLVRQPPTDQFVIDYIDDLRIRTGNELIYAEQCDLASTHSIRKFATRWIDNAPPRRLDMVILCAATLTPPGKARTLTQEGLEETWMVNYLANFHLLSILSPALRAQPPDRDVRIIFASCPSYISSPPLENGDEALSEKDWSPSKSYARSKLALLVFGQAFQKHLDAYKRPDGIDMNARVIFVDPGYVRTPGMRRYLTRGTLWGLGVYLILWQNIWLFLKSSEQGAQSFLYAAMEAALGRGSGGKLLKECMEVDFARVDVKDEKAAKKLWEASDKLIERVEREEAVKRALVKREKEDKEKKAAKKAVDTEKVVPVTPAEEATGSGTENKKPSRRARKKAS